MTDEDRARIARQYGVAAEKIPEPQIIPPGVSAAAELSRREAAHAAWRIYLRALRFERARKKRAAVRRAQA